MISAMRFCRASVWNIDYESIWSVDYIKPRLIYLILTLSMVLLVFFLSLFHVYTAPRLLRSSYQLIWIDLYPVKYAIECHPETFWWDGEKKSRFPHSISQPSDTSHHHPEPSQFTIFQLLNQYYRSSIWQIIFAVIDCTVSMHTRTADTCSMFMVCSQT